MKRAGIRRAAIALVGLAAVGAMVFGGAQRANAITIIKVDRPEPNLVRIHTFGASYATVSDHTGKLIADCGPKYGTYGACLIALDGIGIHVPEKMPRGNYTVTVQVYDSYESASTYTYIDGPPPPPVNTKLPVVSDPNPHVGETLSASPGQWTNAPTAYEYRWRKCKNNVCTRVEIAPTYVVRPTDAGYRIEVRVFASNATGTGAPATSKRTNFVLP